MFSPHWKLDGSCGNLGANSLHPAVSCEFSSPTDHTCLELGTFSGFPFPQTCFYNASFSLPLSIFPQLPDFQDSGANCLAKGLLGCSFSFWALQFKLEKDQRMAPASGSWWNKPDGSIAWWLTCACSILANWLSFKNRADSSCKLYMINTIT